MWIDSNIFDEVEEFDHLININFSNKLEKQLSINVHVFASLCILLHML